MPILISPLWFLDKAILGVNLSIPVEVFFDFGTAFHLSESCPATEDRAAALVVSEWKR